MDRRDRGLVVLGPPSERPVAAHRPRAEAHRGDLGPPAAQPASLPRHVSLPRGAETPTLPGSGAGGPAGGLGGADDRAVHPVLHPVRERDGDVREPGLRQQCARTRRAPAPRRCTPTSRRARRARPGSAHRSATTSLIPTRPPGTRTRKASRSTAALSGERLTTQFEITTSTVSAGSGISSMCPLRNSTFVGPRLPRRCGGRARASPRSCRARRPSPTGRRDARTAARRCRRPIRGRGRPRPRPGRPRRSGSRTRGWRGGRLSGSSPRSPSS